MAIVAPWASKMSQIPLCDWLPERARSRWRYIVRSSVTGCVPQKVSCKLLKVPYALDGWQDLLGSAKNLDKFCLYQILTFLIAYALANSIARSIWKSPLESITLKSKALSTLIRFQTNTELFCSVFKKICVLSYRFPIVFARPHYNAVSVLKTFLHPECACLNELHACSFQYIGPRNW